MAQGYQLIDSFAAICHFRLFTECSYLHNTSFWVGQIIIVWDHPVLARCLASLAPPTNTISTPVTVTTQITPHTFPTAAEETELT